MNKSLLFVLFMALFLLTGQVYAGGKCCGTKGSGCAIEACCQKGVCACACACCKDGACACAASKCCQGGACCKK